MAGENRGQYIFSKRQNKFSESGRTIFVFVTKIDRTNLLKMAGHQILHFPVIRTKFCRVFLSRQNAVQPNLLTFATIVLERHLAHEDNQKDVQMI